ncbi:MAG: hypothetical protein A3F54_03185 [Candidatus Kerfeldbacteria bacterium RIFCSPHIGHO2_12_FULL_48_17]|uniref:Peptidase MA-like domain-containing protein n=1 Tax=Candidatus Kerfeldbacteria bacterium RIFCSPHIGHO2_12_FULL_48_17 TaxID=1798542 RepID=A0A1G2B989_9BACT|nr:MAG: hypothetical protein A3F54_03185 [Candidatus Kerfeldbacteria bacterium RIFCSPHIGHO2_12_FULL_48_17]
MTNRRRKTKIKFVFEPGTYQKDFYIRHTHSNMQKLARMFPVQLLSLTVHIFRNKNSFLKTLPTKKVPTWFIAHVPKNSTSCIYIFDNKDSITSKKTLSQVLLHEMTHLYINILNPKLSDWLKEGISVYVAAQIFKPSISTTDWKKIAQKNIPFRGVSWKFAAKYNGYNIAGLLVMFFVRLYGWKKFIAAINSHKLTRFSVTSIPLYFGDNPHDVMADFKKYFVK